MRKLRVFIAITAVALAVPLVFAGQQKAKPPRPPAYTPCAFELQVTTREGPDVQVGRDVGTYGPIDQALYVQESLLPDSNPDGVVLLKPVPDTEGLHGPYYGQIRVLNSRIDYFFDTMEGCGVQGTAGTTHPCPFRLIVADGSPVYGRIGKTRTLAGIAFADGRTLLDYCDPLANPETCWVRLIGCYDNRDCPDVPPGGEGYVLATVNVWFH